MKQIRCIAIDDEPMALIIIEQFCKRRGGITLSTYSEPNVGLKAITDEHPDIVFLDIQMNCIDGLAIADAIPDDIPFVFTTAHARYALDGFELNAADFLHKPFSYERFLKAVDKAVMRLSMSGLHSDTIVVKEEYANITIPTDEILFVEALGNYVKIYREGKRNVLSRITMKDIQEMLPSSQFIRIHRSFIVSRTKIEKFNKNCMYLKGTDKSLPIGKSYIEDIENAL